MVDATARALAAKLLASYPGWPLSEMNNLAVADALERIGMDIAADVVEQVALSADRPPSVAQVFEAGRRIRLAESQREEQERLMLVAPSPGIDMPENVKARIAVLNAGWAEGKERDHADGDQVWRQYVRQVRSGPRLRATCGGSGLEPEERDGKLVCPDCGTPVPR